jgi:anthraniloyl-CoA monooxygenase
MNNPQYAIRNPQLKIAIVGAGPAGLYCGLLLKKADPALAITIFERNPPDVTYGWGVVFSDRTLASFQRADYKTYTEVTEQFVIWDAIDVRYRGETIRCGGHVIAAIERRRLLNILQRRCAELGVELRFGAEISSLDDLPESDLVIAADGVNSVIRRAHEDLFVPSIELGKAKYIWLGADKVLDAFNFIFHETDYGLFQVHAYPFSGSTSTFIVECEEETWLRAGLDNADENASLAFCQRLLREDLDGASLLSNNSKWISFPTLKTRNWHADVRGQGSAGLRIADCGLQIDPASIVHRPSSFVGQKVVLLGDAAHTAHFSIGAGTKLAMEDAIALATALEQHSDLEKALNEYELERKPVVETFQRAAHESRTYFETIKRYLGLPPMQFAFQLLTRSGRITYDDLHFRDVRFGDGVDSWFAGQSDSMVRASQAGTGAHSGGRVVTGSSSRHFAPPPLFLPIALRKLVLPSRAVWAMPVTIADDLDGLPGVNLTGGALPESLHEYGLILTDLVAISAGARITPHDCGLYTEAHKAAWKSIVEELHRRSRAMVGTQLGHAGRRGATEPRFWGLDRPLRQGAWPLVSASALSYTAKSRPPTAIDRAGMDHVRNSFVASARIAEQAGFDLLQLHFAQGYLLASFLSPLTNLREDEYGGSLESRALFPLELVDAVREVWPPHKPISVALTADDYAKGGATVEDAIHFACLLKEHGCDLISVHAGQTTPDAEPPYGKGFLTPLSDRIRNEAHIFTMVGGYLSNSNEVNTILAAGRADLCIID